MLAVNSKGETVEITEDDFARFPDEQERRNDLNDFLDYVKSCITEDVLFLSAFQPNYNTDMVIFPFRTPLVSTSHLVKESLEIEEHLDEKQERVDLLKSVFSSKEDGKVKWYFLSVGCIAIERNFVDNAPIAIRYIKPIAYETFKRNFESVSANGEKLDAFSRKYKLIDSVIGLDKPAVLLNRSFFREGKGEASDKALMKICLEWHNGCINPKGKDSNIATKTLLYIGDRRDCYPEYKAIKNMIVKAHIGAYGIIYTKNTVRATLPNGDKFVLFIGGTADDPIYVLGGQAVRSLDELKTLIDEGAYKNESEWFTESVKPFVTSRKG